MQSSVTILSPVNHKLEIARRFIVALFVFFISTGIVLSFTIYSLRVTPYYVEHLEYWKITLMTATIIFMVNIIVIIINARVKYVNRNFFDKGPPENPTVIYLISLPLIIYVLCVLIFISTAFYCSTSIDLIFAICTIILFMFIAFLVINITSARDTGEMSLINVLNTFTLVITVASLWNLGMYTIVLQQTQIFIEVMNVTKPILFNKCRMELTTDMKWNVLIYRRFSPFLKCAIIGLVICLTPLMLRPLRFQLNLINQNVNSYLQSSKVIRPVKYFKLLIFTALLTMSNLLFTVFCKISTYSKLEICLQIGVLAEYLLMTSVTITMLDNLRFVPKVCKEVFDWPEHILLWCGIIGENIVSITRILMGIDLLLHGEDTNKSYLWVDMIINFVNFCQSSLQATILSLMLECRIKQEENASRKSLRTLSFLMGGCNVFLMVHHLFNIGFYYYLSTEFHTDLFYLGLMASGHPLVLLYRSLSCIIFVWSFIRVNCTLSKI